ncbi:MAG: hypothetical protein sL5_03120 [Candidatus Mesenet longicola]|uniref:Uncharacterized protein n=1 Tax=Candidatus Mesenet longicola TaxID=1892558 RepID=A0A8J3HNW0_9RICK|nr:MAG: hypothetical protein sGL2_03410 [Candidatus Mesenet longicola]GHM59319.1 MAG: hypothetical protein sL5_03120 [Candidatus Mesenet longicola]
MVGENNKNINPVAKLDIPLSLFSYKDYNSDFIISWYNVASKIYKQINYSSAEKQRLNLALSVLMFPYIALTALGIASHRQAIKKNHKDPTLNEKKTNQAKKLAYNILTLAVVCINVVILTALLIPATVALAIFYALNKELSKDLITVLKISKENRYENQNIIVSIHDEEIETSEIKFDVEIELPKQFHRLIRDLTKDSNWVEITSDKKGDITLKLSANITLKDGLIPLRSEIKKLLDTTIKEFTATIGKLIALESKDITHNKLKELLNEFRLKIVDSIDPRIISSLVEDAYKVAFIQAIKVGKERRKEEFISEDKLKEVLIKQELKDQGEKLPTEKEIIIKELNALKGKKINANDVDDKIYQILKLEYKALLHKSEYKALPGEEGLIEKTNIDIYREYFPQKIDSAISKAGEKVKELKHRGKERYIKIESKLKKMHEDLKKENVQIDNDISRAKKKIKELKQKGGERCTKIENEQEEIYNKALKRKNAQDDNLKQELKDLFTLDIDKDTLHQNFRRSQLDKAVSLLKHIPWNEVKILTKHIDDEVDQSSTNNHRKLHELIVDYNERATDEEINNLINETVEVIAKHKLRSLYEQQKENGLELLSEDNIKFFNSKKIIEPESFKNASLELLKGKIEKQYENLKNEHDSIKTNYDLVKELIDESLKNLDLELKSLSRGQNNNSICKKIEENIEKLNKIRYEINDEIQEDEIKKKISIIKEDMDALVKLYKEEVRVINTNIQSDKVRVLDSGDNIPIASINKLINQCKIVNNEVNIQNRLKKQIIEIHLKNSEKFLQLLKQLKLEQEELTINEETENAYKARLLSNEKIKFSIIENRLIELLKKENFDEIKTEIKTLLEVVELEYCLADKCIKNPTVMIKDNIKHFCQGLLSPLIDELTTNFINNLQKDKDDGWINYGKKRLNAAKNWIQLGVGNNKYKNTNNTLDLANKTIEEVDEITQFFETTYEEMGGLIGNTFSDEGETFRNIVWPRIKDNLYEIWGRFLQDIEIEIIPPIGKTLLNPKVKANTTQKIH